MCLTMGSAAETIADLHRNHYRELIAPLIRVIGSFERAEDIVQDAFAKALEKWSEDCVPTEPLAWLKRVARNRAIDLIRRQTSWRNKQAALIAEADTAAVETNAQWWGEDDDQMRDDSLRLIFVCCHPSLAPEARIALTLKTVCGLTTNQVARTFLIKPTTLQQRLVRAKRKIDDAKIPFVIPDRAALPQRTASVLKTIYLVFNEGYETSDGDELISGERCEEGIRLGRLLSQLLPDHAAPKALLALMLLHHSRRDARTDARGDLVTLDEQDRSSWDHQLIAEALPLVESSLRQRPISNYAIEAAIAALHARATDADETDWAQIAGLYAVLHERTPANPVIALNRAVAIAMAGNVTDGLARIRALDEGGELASYHLIHAARADLQRRAGQLDAAEASYRQARDLATNAVEKRFIDRRLVLTSEEKQRKS